MIKQNVSFIRASSWHCKAPPKREMDLTSFRLTMGIGMEEHWRCIDGWGQIAAGSQVSNGKLGSRNRLQSLSNATG